jgi:hypothetical protein
LITFVHEADGAGFRISEAPDFSIGSPVLDVLGKSYTFAFIDFRVV